MQGSFFTALQLWRSLLGAIIFYTICPIPPSWQPSFHRIARWCPLIGLILGSILALVFWGLTLWDSPSLLKSVIIVALWLGLTGGLHFDGAMDSADGLAVTDPKRRLEVMADSVSGAFGVMSAIVILLLKVAAISAMTLQESWLLPLTLAWGRWSQVTAIAFYPYLKPDGKGAFHKRDFLLPQDFLFSLIPPLLIPIGLCLTLEADRWHSVLISGIGLLIALGTSKWFNYKFQGQTGDTYGAIVEWTEAILLSAAILLINRL